MWVEVATPPAPRGSLKSQPPVSPASRRVRLRPVASKSRSLFILGRLRSFEVVEVAVVVEEAPEVRWCDDVGVADIWAMSCPPVEDEGGG